MYVVPATIPWLRLGLGGRGRITWWPGGTSNAWLWEFGIRQRFELVLWRFRPWVGLSTTLGNIVVQGALNREAFVLGLDFAGGLRFRLPGPLLVGAFVESSMGTTFTARSETFRTLRLGAELAIAFDLALADGPPSRPSEVD
jgi:hypothetical protein